MNTAEDKHTLIVGWGNDLRGDDAVGHHVIERLRGEDLRGIDLRSMQQAGPEFAAEMAGMRRVILVDASVEVEKITIRRVVPAETLDDGGLGHALSPETLLCLTRVLYGAEPALWAVHIPVSQFEFGQELCPTTAAHVGTVCQCVLRLAQCPTVDRDHCECAVAPSMQEPAFA